MAAAYGVNIKNLILANQYIKITKVIDNIIDIWYNVLKCITIKNLRCDLIQGGVTMINLNTGCLKQMFAKYDYIMTTAQLNLEKLYYSFSKA